MVEHDYLGTLTVHPRRHKLPTVALSLSHSSGAGLSVVAPAGVAVGCDLETVEPRSPEFLADYFTVEEQTLV